MNKVMDIRRGGHRVMPSLMLNLQYDFLQIMPNQRLKEITEPPWVKFSVVQANEEGCRVSVMLPDYLEFQLINPKHQFWNVFNERLRTRQFAWVPENTNHCTKKCIGFFESDIELSDDLVNHGLLFTVIEGNYNTEFRCRLAYSGSVDWSWK
jgi:hypothetical protein